MPSSVILWASGVRGELFFPHEYVRWPKLKNKVKQRTGRKDCSINKSTNKRILPAQSFLGRGWLDCSWFFSGYQILDAFWMLEALFLTAWVKMVGKVCSERFSGQSGNLPAKSQRDISPHAHMVQTLVLLTQCILPLVLICHLLVHRLPYVLSKERKTVLDNAVFSPSSQGQTCYQNSTGNLTSEIANDDICVLKIRFPMMIPFRRFSMFTQETTASSAFFS